MVTPPRLVTRSAGFLCLKAAKCSNPLNWGNQTTVTKPPKTHGRTIWVPTALFLRFHLQNHKNASEIGTAVDNLSVESDRQAKQGN